MEILIIVAAYFLPAIVASVRSHRNTGAIVILNLFLGWTALVWSATSNTARS